MSESMTERVAYTHLARAAIAAMRTPTDEMVDKTFDAEPLGDYENDATGYLRDVWQAMIDAALESK
jgi:hypothetical protein